jgi:hypothetical protein
MKAITRLLRGLSIVEPIRTWRQFGEGFLLGPAFGCRTPATKSRYRIFSNARPIAGDRSRATLHKPAAIDPELSRVRDFAKLKVL